MPPAATTTRGLDVAPVRAHAPHAAALGVDARDGRVRAKPHAQALCRAVERVRGLEGVQEAVLRAIRAAEKDVSVEGWHELPGLPGRHEPGRDAVPALHGEVLFELLHLARGVRDEQVALLLKLDVAGILEYLVGVLVELDALFAQPAVHIRAPLHAHARAAAPRGAGAQV